VCCSVLQCFADKFDTSAELFLVSSAVEVLGHVGLSFVTENDL